MLLRTLHIAESFEAKTSNIAGSLLGLDSALCQHDLEPSYCATTTVSDFQVSSLNSLSTLIAEAQLVHIHGWGSDISRTAARMALKLGRPYLISSLGTLVLHTFTRESRVTRLRSWLSDRRLIKGALSLTALNEPERDELTNRFPANRVDTLTYGLDFDQFRSITPDAPASLLLPEGKILLHLGPIHPQEGLVALLKSFAELGLDSEGWAVVLAGEDAEGWQEKLEAAVRRKGAYQQVSFIRASDLATQRYLLSRASIFIATGLHFRSPATILQAMACEVPVLASKQLTPAGLEHVIRVCEPTRESIRPALGALMKCDEDQRKEIVSTALGRAKEIADWRVCAKSWASLYEQIIK